MRGRFGPEGSPHGHRRAAGVERFGSLRDSSGLDARIGQEAGIEAVGIGPFVAYRRGRQTLVGAAGQQPRSMPNTNGDHEFVAPTVLLVEDDDDSRLIYRTILGSAGLEIVTAGDGAAGLRVASILRPSVIVLDIGLPLLDGVGVLRAIRRDPLLRATPVIALTGRVLVHEQHALADAGFDHVLLKPIEPAAVLAAIQARLDGGSQTPRGGIDH